MIDWWGDQGMKIQISLFVERKIKDPTRIVSLDDQFSTAGDVNETSFRQHQNSPNHSA